MKKTLALILIVCLLAVPAVYASAEDVTDLSVLNDEQLVALLAEVQTEIVARHIEKTASLPAGTYIGGRDVPVGSYVLATAGTEDDYGIRSFGQRILDSSKGIKELHHVLFIHRIFLPVF